MSWNAAARLLGRRPKDFDIGTSAHPYQVKKLFRNCWIIGRRFRLAHVKFGPKVIEVATFRRQLAPGEEVVQDGVPAPIRPARDGEPTSDHRPEARGDNTFGTPEEDAFRRDFTINALFYDIDSFSVIDYVGGLDDLRAGIVRSIGDPEVRFREDPVRMLRAVALACRLGFTIDPPSLEAIRALRHEIARSSPPRMLEEYYKILRAGSAERTFRELAALGLLEPISAELHHGAVEALWRSLAALDAYRAARHQAGADQRAPGRLRAVAGEHRPQAPEADDDPGAAADEMIREKVAYLNPTFFFVRAAIFFAVWGLLFQVKDDYRALATRGRVIFMTAKMLASLALLGLSVWIARRRAAAATEAPC